MKSHFSTIPKPSTSTSVETSTRHPASSDASTPRTSGYDDCNVPPTAIYFPELKIPSNTSSMLTSGNKPFDTSSAFAYSGVSEFSGPSVSFTSGVSDSLTVKVRIPLCYLALPDSGSTSITANSSFPAFSLSQYDLDEDKTAVYSAEVLALSPATNIGARSYTTSGGSLWLRPAFADCSVLEILSAAFSKYRMKSDLQLDYMPQCATSDTTAFSLCFADDPYHPINGLGCFTPGGNQPGYTTTKNSVNSIVFSCWAPWKLKCKLDTSLVYYTASETVRYAATTETGTYTNYNLASQSADLRQSHFGTIMAYCNQAGSGSLPKGQLYTEYEVEFFDLVPVIPGASLPFDYLFALNLLATRGHFKSDVPRLLRTAPTLKSSGFYKTSSRRNAVSVSTKPRRGENKMKSGRQR